MVFLFETTSGRELLHIGEGAKLLLDYSYHISSAFSPDSRFFAVGFLRGRGSISTYGYVGYLVCSVGWLVKPQDVADRAVGEGLFFY